MANETNTAGGMRIALREPEAQIVREIMERTGVGTGADAIAMLLRQCGRRFVKWWDAGCGVLIEQTPPAVPALAPEPEDQPEPDFGEPLQI